MNFLNNFIPTYNYHYFDQDQQIQTKKLNTVQVFFRRIFGAYQETHLLKVVKKAYLMTLNGEFQQTNNKKTELLKLILKAQRVYGRDSSAIDLPVTKLSNKEEVKVNISYDINKMSHKISLVEFRFDFIHSNRTQTHHVKLFKNVSQKLVVDLPVALLNELESSSRNFFINDRKVQEIQVINQFIAKILRDSSSSQVTEIHYYGKDHRWTFKGFNHNPYTSNDDLNDKQEKFFEKLGWKYLKQYTRQGGIGLADVKRVYLFRKEDAKDKATLSFKQTLSMDFVESLLEMGEKEC